MRILETYVCFQGEGRDIGRPSVLCRTFGCNLHCSWCDTAYAINSDLLKREAGPPIKQVNVRDLTMDLQYFHLPVILTGGEPTIQDDFVPLIRELCRLMVPVTVETNGTNSFHMAQVGAVPGQVFWSISPKMSGANTKPPNLQALQVMVDRWPTSDLQFKFVLTGSRDLDEAAALLSACNVKQDILVVLQPNGELLDEPEAYWALLGWIENSVMSSEAWRQRNVRVLPQLHALAHGQRVRYV